MIFTVGLHPVFKTLGLKMEGRDHFDPLGPMAVAHDLLEHFPDDDGSEEHELLAVGASWFVRSYGRYLEYKGFPRFDSVVEHLIANISNVVDSLNGRRLVPPLDEPINWTAKVEKYIAEAAKSELVSNLPVREWRAIVYWLLKGHERAVDRYSPHDSLVMCEVFRSIEDQAAGYLQGARTGDQCRIILDLKVPKATLEKEGK